MKKIIFTYLITMNAFFCLSQSAQIDWQNMVGGSLGDIPRSLFSTSDGGAIIAGESVSQASGDKSENSIGSFGESDYWIVKLDDQGVVEWENTIGGDFEDNALSVREVPSGGFIIAGESTSQASGDKSENSLQYDLWVVRLDQNGVIVWENTINADKRERNPRIALSDDGGFVIGITSTSDVSVDKEDPNNGQTDIWIIKLNSQGDIVWENSIGGSGFDDFKDIKSTADGGFLIAGTSTSNISGDKTENSKGGHDYWLVKVDNLGEVLWDKTIGGGGSDFVSSIALLSDGNYILTGYSDSDASSDKTENSLGEFDYWVVKINQSGAIIWDNTIGGSSNDTDTSAIALDGSKVLIIGHSFSNISGDKTEENSGISDLWIVQLDGNGTIEEQDTVGGSAGEFVFFLENVSNTNDLYLIASSTSSESGDITEIGNGNVDYWVARLNGTLNLNDNYLEEEIKIFPNPTTSEIFLNTKSLPVTNFDIYNVLGKRVLRIAEVLNNQSINVDILPSGVYLVKFEVDGIVYSDKVIKN